VSGLETYGTFWPPCAIGERLCEPGHPVSTFSGHRGRDHERRKWAESAPTEVAPRRTGVRAKSRESIACEGGSLPEAELPLRQIYGQTSTHGDRRDGERRSAADMLTSARSPGPMLRRRRNERSGAATGHTRANMRTPSPTTRFCSASWLIGSRARQSEIASWSTIPLRPMGSIEARSRADISSTVRGLEAADRLRKKRLRQPKHRLGEKDREGDRDEEDHVDRQ
jgi:hypothetical protein